MKVVIGAICTVSKEFVPGPEDLEIRRLEDTIQTTALLKSARILRRIPGRPEKTCCHSKSRKKPSATPGVKNSQENNDSFKNDNEIHFKIKVTKMQDLAEWSYWFEI